MYSCNYNPLNLEIGLRQLLDFVGSVSRGEPIFFSLSALIRFS